MNELNQITSCKSCGAPIVWMDTKRGKKICVDVPDDDDPARLDVLESKLFDRQTMKTHFETCPQADQFRRQRSGGAVQQTPPPANSENILIVRKLNAAIVTLTDISNKDADGVRAIEIAKAGLSTIRMMR